MVTYVRLIIPIMALVLVSCGAPQIQTPALAPTVASVAVAPTQVMVLPTSAPTPSPPAEPKGENIPIHRLEKYEVTDGQLVLIIEVEGKDSAVLHKTDGSSRQVCSTSEGCNRFTYSEGGYNIAFDFKAPGFGEGSITLPSTSWKWRKL